MGCDIHLCRERKVNGIWETSTTERIEQYGEDEDEVYTSISNGIEDFEITPPRYVGRSYTLFSFLSNVRSYDDKKWFVDPIAEDRGFPEDICEIHKKLLDDEDLHSPGYVTMQELLDLITATKEELLKASIGASSHSTEELDHLLIRLTKLVETVNWDNYFEGLDPQSECRILICYDN